jgi:hypothetical protein
MILVEPIDNSEHRETGVIRSGVRRSYTYRWRLTPDAVTKRLRPGCLAAAGPFVRVSGDGEDGSSPPPRSRIVRPTQIDM